MGGHLALALTLGDEIAPSLICPLCSDTRQEKAEREGAGTGRAPTPRLLGRASPTVGWGESPAISR